MYAIICTAESCFDEEENSNIVAKLNNEADAETFVRRHRATHMAAILDADPDHWEDMFTSEYVLDRAQKLAMPGVSSQHVHEPPPDIPTEPPGGGEESEFECVECGAMVPWSRKFAQVT